MITLRHWVMTGLMGLTGLTGYCETTTTDDMGDIAKVLAQADVQTLVIFDVDDVLMRPTQEFDFRHPARKEFIQQVQAQEGGARTFQDYVALIFERRTVELMDPRVTGILKGLAERHVPAIALSSWWTGRFGHIEKMEELRFEGLAQLGLVFKELAPFEGEYSFAQLNTGKGTPIYRDGVLLTSFEDKGAALKALLKAEKKAFSKVIFIDDDVKNVEAVEAACQELAMAFTGIHYTAKKKQPLPELDAKKEALRFEILGKEGVWLLDAELEKRMAQATTSQ